MLTETSEPWPRPWVPAHFQRVLGARKANGRLLLRMAIAALVSILVHWVLLQWVSAKEMSGALHRSLGASVHALRVSMEEPNATAMVPSLGNPSRLQRSPPPQSALTAAVASPAPAPLSSHVSPPPLFASADTAETNLAGRAPVVSNTHEATLPARPPEISSNYLTTKDVDREPVALEAPAIDPLSVFPPAVEPIRMRIFVSDTGKVDRVTVLYAADVDRALAAALADAMAAVPYMPARLQGDDVAAYFDFEVQLVSANAPSVRPGAPIVRIDK